MGFKRFYIRSIADACSWEPLFLSQVELSLCLGCFSLPKRNPLTFLAKSSFSLVSGSAPGIEF